MQYTVEMDNFETILVEQFGTNEPIFIGEIKSLFPYVTEVTIFNWLNNALEEETLRKYQRGVYYLPDKTDLLGLGERTLSPNKVIMKKYISNLEDVYGFRSGLNLDNEVHISPQVPATLEITTNKASARVREIEPFGGYRKITLKRPRVGITKENVDAQRFLDVITRVPLEALSNFERKRMAEFTQEVEKARVLDCLPYYPAKTSKKLMESGYFDVLA